MRHHSSQPTRYMPPRYSSNIFPLLRSPLAVRCHSTAFILSLSSKFASHSFPRLPPRAFLGCAGQLRKRTCSMHRAAAAAAKALRLQSPRTFICKFPNELQIHPSRVTTPTPTPTPITTTNPQTVTVSTLAAASSKINKQTNAHTRSQIVPISKTAGRRELWACHREVFLSFVGRSRCYRNQPSSPSVPFRSVPFTPDTKTSHVRKKNYCCKCLTSE